MTATQTRGHIRRAPTPEFAPDSLEARNVEAALEAKGMLWTVGFQPLFTEHADTLGGIKPVTSHRALVRSDNGEAVGIHGGGYEPLQQMDAFGGIQPLLDAGEARITSCGSTQQGRKVFIETEIGESRVPVKVGDLVRMKLVFSNSHDGTSPATAAYIAERLVCLNGMTSMSRSNMFRGRHTRGIHAALAAWQREFQVRRDEMAAQVETFRGFTRRRLNRNALTAYVREVLSPGAGANEETVVRGVDRIVELATEAPGAEPDTLWGGLNAITYWATHERGRSDDARLTSNLFGQGTQLIERATAVATQLVERLPLVELARESYANHATAKSELDRLLGRSHTISTEPSLF